jgi:hypothetical protein
LHTRTHLTARGLTGFFGVVEGRASNKVWQA